MSARRRLGRWRVAGPVLLAACGGGDGGEAGTGPPPGFSFEVRAGGNNVPERYSSDLWVHGSWAYTGTWGGDARNGVLGDVVKIWSLDPAGAPTLTDSLKVPGIATVSDVQVSEDGAVLVFSAERGVNAGVYVYDLADPARPAFRDSVLVAEGVHTATIADIDGRRYVFAARNPQEPGAAGLRHHRPRPIALRATVPIPPAYGIHDTYVRDGLAFVFAWNTGVIIYDVGNGVRNGRPGGARGSEPAGDRCRRRAGRVRGAQRVVVPQSGAE